MRAKTPAVLLVLSLFGSLLSAGGALADGPVFGERVPSDRYRIRTRPQNQATVLAERDGLVITSLNRDDVATARALLQRQGDGGGGDIVEESLLLIQTRFVGDVDASCGFPPDCEGPCNVVLLLWDETAFNAEGVNVFVDGALLGTIAGLPQNELPGVNGLNIIGVPEGLHTFAVEDPDGGTSDQCEITVRDDKPFSDAGNIQCQGAGQDAVGNCKMLVTWETAGAGPELWLVLVGGVSVGRFTPGSQKAELISDLDVPATLSPGSEQTVTVIPFLFESECAVYRGCFVDASCTLNCELLECNPPVALDLCQSGYGDAASTVVQASWLNGEDNYVGVLGFVDDLGNSIGTLPGDAQGAFFSGIDPGELVLAVQGDCGDPAGSSTQLSGGFTVLESTPHPEPIEPGSLECEVVPEDGGTFAATVTWVNALENSFIDLFVIAPPDTPDGSEQIFFAGTIAGGLEEVEIVNLTSEDERVALQFFALHDNGLCYGSDLVECGGTTPTFIRGPCGSPDAIDPQITHAITIFGFLFLGQETPPCLEACNVNGDTSVNITDGIFLLQFLFSGGPGPFNWVDSDEDPAPDPTCEPVTEGMDCQTPSTVCPLQ